jgi:hypothetical protein
MPANSTGFNIRRVIVGATADGNNTVLTSPGVGKGYLIIGGNLRAVGAGIVILQSGASRELDSFTGVVAPGTKVSYDSHPDVGVFYTDDNAALVINNAAGVDTTGFFAYRIITF